MPDPEDTDQWISDAREAGLPVFVTGVLLLVVVLGIPMTVAGTLVLLPMLMVMTVISKRLFFPSEPD